MSVLSGLAWVVALVAFVPSLILLTQVAAAATARGRRDAAPAGAPDGTDRRPRTAVLMPAHDEATIIDGTLRRLMPQLQPEDRVVVVADNCSDDTARLARATGAEVIERFDRELRGKSHALGYGLRYLQDDPPDVVVVVDADCTTSPGALDALSRECGRLHRPVQSLYLMRAPAGTGPRARVAEFAWLVRNGVRPLGSSRLGLPCQVMGSGIALPWDALREVSPANGELAEDYKFGVDLALSGFAPSFCPDARVESEFPAAAAAQKTQRTRWEHGSLQLMARELPRLLRAFLRRRDPALLGLLLDLMVPPLALLALLLLLAVALGVPVAWSGNGAMPLLLALGGAAAFATAVLIAWVRWGRAVVDARTMLAVPWYVLRKVPLYLRAVAHRQRAWVKTARQ
jgi:cellulose synthase/poly-beta-1,6-N-acetylglucosamine synthase-like glycosyltransferase